MKRTTILIICAIVLALPGCKFVKAGARCSASEGAGRNDTHVLFCTNGKWKPALTIQQAADFITGTWPATILAPAGTSIHTVAGQPVQGVYYLVRDRNGRPVPGVKVTLTVPTSPAANGQPGLEPGGVSVVTTDERGLAEFNDLRSTLTFGDFTGMVTAEKPGGQLELPIQFRIIAGPASDAKGLSGSGQTVLAGQTPAPIVVEFRDQFGNLTPDVQFAFDDPDQVLTGAQVTRDGARVTIVPPASTEPGVKAAAIYATNSRYENGRPVDVGVVFGWFVDPGPAASYVVFGAGQSTAVTWQFADLVVIVYDQFGNETEAPGDVTWTMIPDSNGATATVTPFDAGDDRYRAHVLAGSQSGTVTVRVDVEGVGTQDAVLHII